MHEDMNFISSGENNRLKPLRKHEESSYFCRNNGQENGGRFCLGRAREHPRHLVHYFFILTSENMVNTNVLVSSKTHII